MNFVDSHDLYHDFTFYDFISPFWFCWKLIFVFVLIFWIGMLSWSLATIPWFMILTPLLDPMYNIDLNYLEFVLVLYFFFSPFVLDMVTFLAIKSRDLEDFLVKDHLCLTLIYFYFNFLGAYIFWFEVF
jgi:hypothetical protein